MKALCNVCNDMLSIIKMYKEEMEKKDRIINSLINNIQQLT